jgi:hypothetical protein
MSKSNGNGKEEGPRLSRVGMFSIPTERMGLYPGMVRRVMGKCIIFSAQHIPEQGVVLYSAECEDFDEIDSVKEKHLPEYAIKIGPGPIRPIIHFERITGK